MQSRKISLQRVLILLVPVVWVLAATTSVLLRLEKAATTFGTQRVFGGFWSLVGFSTVAADYLQLRPWHRALAELRRFERRPLAERLLR